MHALYLEISIMKEERTAGVDISRGSYKEKPTELSWQYAHLQRERTRFSIEGRWTECQ